MLIENLFSCFFILFFFFFYASSHSLAAILNDELGIFFSEFNDILLFSALICYKLFSNPFLMVNKHVSSKGS